jgi:hypothetical protein
MRENWGEADKMGTTEITSGGGGEEEGGQSVEELVDGTEKSVMLEMLQVT